MAIVKGCNSQILQDREKGKSILPLSSSSPTEDEEDDLPPVAQSASSLPSVQQSPSPPPYSPATYSAARSLSPSPIYLPTPILNPSQGSSEERCLPASPSAIQHSAPVSPVPHNLSLRQLLQLLPLLSLLSQIPLLIPLQLPIMHLQELVSSFKMNLKFYYFGQELATESSCALTTTNGRSS
ncbi:hypothetical protein Pcinc_010857 [Petrolisthes cinctipes]|uniref:Uncharacterized protein n=1 Tax=Petrolisthes cinctipes TaxID=88211 RepID=A0AAE1G863_PETCI|nr:hypothetical protein Pcinc_010857 [Petrolisthes cinctipes]